MFKILYIVAALSGDQTIESVGRWDTFEACEMARAEATAPDVPKTIIALHSTCIRAMAYVPMYGGGGGPSRSVSPH